MKEHISNNIKAIVAGLFGDLATQFVLGLIVSLATGIAFWLFSDAGSSGERFNEATIRWSSSSALRVIDGISELLAHIVGGYIAGRVGRNVSIRPSFLVGVLWTLSTFSFAAMEFAFGWPSQAYRWSDLSFAVLAIPAALIGGYLNRLQRRAT